MTTERLAINGKYEINLLPHRADFYRNRTWEAERLDSMHEHIGPGDVVYYVGAEQGEMPALCQMWGAQVVLFEPSPTAWPVIRATWEANGLERPIWMLAIFAGRKTNDVPIPFSRRPLLDGWPPCSTGEIVPESRFCELQHQADTIPVIAIDEIGLVIHPTAISIDVEGAEFEVLRGASKTIATHRPKIWLSLHPKFLKDYWNSGESEVLKWIQDRGYTCELLADEHEQHYFCEVP